MTYCVGISLDAGLIFLCDSRTNAGVDQISTFRKMTVFEKTGDRVLVMMTSGNLAASQAVRQLVSNYTNANGINIWNATSMFEVAQVVGDAIRAVFLRDAKALHDFGIEFNIGVILGGQIGKERCRLFQIYSAGNFIEAQNETPYFQIGESKYGKPMLDRVINPNTSLNDAAKCALISMESTLRSNISVGFPLDLLVYSANDLKTTRYVTIDEENPYFEMVRKTWGKQLKNVFENIPAATWNPKSRQVNNILRHGHSEPIKVINPDDINTLS